MFRAHFLVLAAVFASAAVSLHADEPDRTDRQIAPASLVYQYIGRVNLATGTVYGYFTQIAGVPPTTPLFAGAPSESTALFTFRADIRFTPLPGNGDLGGGQFSVTPFVVAPGDFTIYFDASPSRVWKDPKTFSTGQAIGLFTRTIDQQTIIGPISTNVASATLTSSQKITVGTQSIDLGRMVPHGVTNVTTVNNVPLSDGTFAFGGYGLAIGK